jgi:hypothetical protein
MPTRAHPAEAAVERRPANVRRKAGVRAGNGAVRRALTEQWIASTR